MADPLIERMKADRGWLARQMARVPGFKGYLENTTIWEADRLVRQELARRLAEIKAPVNAAIQAASGDIRAGQSLGALEALLTQADKAANQVRFADYGHGALTAKVKPREADLARLLAFDRAMFERLSAAESAAAALGSAGGAGAEALAAELAAFEKQFAERKFCLTATAASAAGGAL